MISIIDMIWVDISGNSGVTREFVGSEENWTIISSISQEETKWKIKRLCINYYVVGLVMVG